MVGRIISQCSGEADIMDGVERIALWRVEEVQLVGGGTKNTKIAIAQLIGFGHQIASGACHLGKCKFQRKLVRYRWTI